MRRVAVLALVLDTLVGAAAFLGALPADGADHPAPRYVEVGEACLEMTDVDARRVAGREVADALCAGPRT